MTDELETVNGLLLISFTTRVIRVRLFDYIGAGMKVSEMKKLLERCGCRKEKEGSNHEIWYSPITKKRFPLPRHNSKELPTGTEKNIRKQAGLD